MITLIILLLIVVGIIYLLFFGILKLIWILCKSNRNFWPLILAGVGTILFCTCVGLGIGWGVKKVMAPFKEVIARTKSNPEITLGPRTYQDDRFPFQLTVFDGMDFSKWIPIGKAYLKIGVDTNFFKTKSSTEKSMLSLLLVRTPVENKENPFAQWENLKNDPGSQTHFKITSEEETTINGFPARRIDAVGYSNRGPLDTSLTIVNVDNQTLYYLIIMNFGNEKKTDQIETTLSSFARPAPPQAPLTLPVPSEP